MLLAVLFHEGSILLRQISKRTQDELMKIGIL